MTIIKPFSRDLLLFTPAARDGRSRKRFAFVHGFIILQSRATVRTRGSESAEEGRVINYLKNPSRAAYCGSEISQKSVSDVI